MPTGFFDKDHKDTLLEHNICISYGHSESPILRKDKITAAMNAVGINILLGKGKNYAVRFDDEFFNLLAEASELARETMNSRFWKI